MEHTVNRRLAGRVAGCLRSRGAVGGWVAAATALAVAAISAAAGVQPSGPEVAPGGPQAPQAPAAPAERVAVKAAVASPRTDDFGKGRQAALAGRMAAAAKAGSARVVLLGDSITAQWEGPGKAALARMRAKLGGPDSVAVLAIGGDRTQHVLWRLKTPEAVAMARPEAGRPPEWAYILIGTNNLNEDKSEEIVQGVLACAREVRKVWPTTGVVVLGVLPRGSPNDGLGKRVPGLNGLLKAAIEGQRRDGAGGMDRVDYRDIGARFVEKDGTISKEIMPDMLHLSPAAYERFADALLEDLEPRLTPAKKDGPAAPAGAGAEGAPPIALAPAGEVTRLTSAIVIEGVARGGRVPFPLDAVAFAVATDTLGQPKAGDELRGLPPPGAALSQANDGPMRTWRAVDAGEDGAFSPQELGPAARGGYALVRVHSDKMQAAILHATGHSMVYVEGRHWPTGAAPLRRRSALMADAEAELPSGSIPRHHVGSGSAGWASAAGSPPTWEPRVGDPYSHGYVRLPVLLHEGTTSFLFALAGRGSFSATLEHAKPEPATPNQFDSPGPTPIAGALQFNPADLTLPDIIEGESGPWEIGVVVMNPSDSWRWLRVTRVPSDGTAVDSANLRTHLVAPFSVSKLPVRLSLPADAAGPSIKVPLGVWSFRAGTEVLHDTLELTLAVKPAHVTHKRTFVSGIDGSVQYYSVVPPTAEGLAALKARGERPGLVLSLHGASVEATNQAAAYSPKDWCYIVCPTNRRPFGFDWEDAGRIDALEVLAEARARFHTDPRRQCLTGHSMGGHGTWHLGVMHPELFAAIAPSAGWLSFDTYTGPRLPKQNDPAIEELAAVFRQASSASETPLLLGNLRGKPVYILHGDADDNVPVREARLARELLTKLGIEHRWHEQPGAGHWWDGDASPGADCVDWPPIFEMFRSARLPASAPAESVRLHPRGGPDANLRPLTFAQLPALPPNGLALLIGTHGSPAESAWALAKARFDAEQWWYRGNGFARIDTADSDPLWHGLSLFSDPAIVYGHTGMAPDRVHTPEEAAGANILLVSPRGVGVAAAPGSEPGLTPGTWATLDRLGSRTLRLAGTDLNALRATDRLPLFLSGVGYPNPTVFSPEVWRVGLAGVDGRHLGLPAAAPPVGPGAP